jgi:hypothetical protein
MANIIFSIAEHLRFNSRQNQTALNSMELALGTTYTQEDTD